MSFITIVDEVVNLMLGFLILKLTSIAQVMVHFISRIVTALAVDCLCLGFRTDFQLGKRGNLD